MLTLLDTARHYQPPSGDDGLLQLSRPSGSGTGSGRSTASQSIWSNTAPARRSVAFAGWSPRYYDPATGQFLTRDPIEMMTGDPYGYANGNPLMFTDPTGLISFDEIVDSTLTGISTGMSVISTVSAGIAVGCAATIIGGPVCTAPMATISGLAGLTALSADYARYQLGYTTGGEAAGSFCGFVSPNPVSTLACALLPPLIDDAGGGGMQRLAYMTPQEECLDE